MLLLLFLLPALALAEEESILQFSERFFSESSMPRVGIEVEFQNLKIAEAAKILQKSLGGRVESKKIKVETTLKEIKADGTRVYNEIDGVEYYIKGSRAGEIILKEEINLLDDTNVLLSTSPTVEVVGPPQNLEQVKLLDEAIRQLQPAGARGTDASTAVSIQVNMEMYEGKKPAADLKSLLAMMRNYLDPENKAAMMAELDVPPIRQTYIQDYSPGFMKKLMNSQYSPSWDEFYDDFFIRQSAELEKMPGAWSKPIEEVRADVMGMENKVVPRVIKQNRMRISSLLLWMRPEDAFSKAIIDSGWAKAIPIVEFREANNDFDVMKNVRRFVGLRNLSQRLGYIPHNLLQDKMRRLDCGGFFAGLRVPF